MNNISMMERYSPSGATPEPPARGDGMALSRRLERPRGLHAGSGPSHRIARVGAMGGILLAAVLGPACAGRVAPAPSGPAGQVRLFWRLRAGPLDGDQKEVCRSDRPQPCAIQASTPGRPVFAGVSLFVYPAGAPTTYEGAVRLGFIDWAGKQGYEMQVDGQSDPGELPSGFTAMGRVTAEPGDYELRIALSGRTRYRSEPVRIERTIAVHVENVRAG